MGLKQFSQDVIASKATRINGVSNIRRGDSDGEVVFSWSLDDATPPLDIQILVPDVDAYPKNSSVMIFTESEHSTVDVSSILERLSASLANKSIQTVIQAVAERLLAKVEGSATTDEDSLSDANLDADSDDALDSEDDEEVESEYDEYVDDGPFPPTLPRPRISQPGDTSLSIARLKAELQAVRATGISLGVFPRGPLQRAEFFSFSLRVGKLGVPEHALEAWGVERHEYLVLLCRFWSPYPTISEMLNDPGLKPQFRFGKCSEPKPSIDSARSALATASDADFEDQNALNNKVKDANGNFQPIYMSNSINMLMNHEFLVLLKMRRNEAVSWDGALSRYKLRHDGIPSQNRDSSNDCISDIPISENTIPSLRHDFASDEDNSLSLPLVAMQFALRHFVRCTKYCMVCHQRLENEFEALKPYVCNRPLCAFQFTTLGLGASIEHEIVSNPYVVDILISFFTAALANPKSLRSYPVGLGIKCLLSGDHRKPESRLAAEACFLDRTIRFSSKTRAIMDPRIKVGDSLMVVINHSASNNSSSSPNVLSTLSTAAMLSGHFERHICKVTNIVADCYKFEVVATFTGPPNVMPLPESELPTEVSNTNREWKDVTVLQYKYDTDHLNDYERSLALGMVACGIPSVLDMRKYLLDNPRHRLASWSRLDRNSLTLLQWIISSNRSLILQDGAVPNLAEQAQPPEATQDTRPKNSHQVKGLPPHWMQFRFLQGTPEREHLFMKEIMAVSQSGGEQSQFPTIFAWHGSALPNWHSIIRTGLDFNNTLNGRVYGNGVYMSNNFAVSQGYCGNNRLPNPTHIHWNNSVLKPSAAISICEVVNRCDKFVSLTPHYVVNQIEWIQCRYLFVAVDPTGQTLELPLPNKPRETGAGCVPQQPSRSLLAGFASKVEIPLSALPSNRRHLVSSGDETKDFEKFEEICLESDHGETDHELLLDCEEDGAEDDVPRSNKRRSSSVVSTDHRSFKLSSAAYAKKMPGLTTDFKPGSLDLESLIKLPDPSWASSSPLALKTLTRSIKEMQEIQQGEHLTSLGWYIDFENISNVFHWTVELHSFELDLPLAQDMERNGCTSVVLEFRFGANFPYSPPFVRVIRPRFLPFSRGGGGHVTAGGAICSEMLTNSGWSAALTMEKVLLQIRLGLTERDRPARLESANGMIKTGDYGIGEAIDAYKRAARLHGWQIPEDIETLGVTWATAAPSAVGVVDLT